MLPSPVRSLAAAAALALPLALVAAPAGARPLEHGTFHDDFAGTITDFCDVSGFDVSYVGTADGKFLANTRGPNGTVYGAEHVLIHEVTTNLANGLSTTLVERTLSKDLHVTNNGDGTWTIIVLATGNSTLYGPDGRTIARNPGQVRFRIVIDDAGTPDDPSDDVEVSFEQIKGSTGRSDDYCAATLAAIG